MAGEATMAALARGWDAERALPGWAQTAPQLQLLTEHFLQTTNEDERAAHQRYPARLVAGLSSPIYPRATGDQTHAV